MDAALLQTLGELLLNAVPTVAMFIIIWAAYRLMVHKPLLAVLAERHEKTTGAVSKAQADIAAADAKSAEYERRIRESRAEIFNMQEARRKQLLDTRDAAIAEARSKAEGMVKAAKADVQKDAASAKGQLQAQAEQMANEIIRAVLHSGPAAQAVQP
jgi:F-type H+-transporting ATPase subunit b